jgi:transposase
VFAVHAALSTADIAVPRPSISYVCDARSFWVKHRREIRSSAGRVHSRRRAWNQAAGRTIPKSPGRRGPTTGNSRQIARSRHALWKNPTDLNGRQRQQLDWIAKTDPRLWRAYLLKEGLRYVFATGGEEGKDALDRWLAWARRSRLESFVHLAHRITKHREAIEANLEHGLSQGLIESTNTKIRLLTRIAFEFHGPEPLIALALLALGSHPPQLPGRT